MINFYLMCDFILIHIQKQYLPLIGPQHNNIPLCLILHTLNTDIGMSFLPIQCSQMYIIMHLIHSKDNNFSILTANYNNLFIPKAPLPWENMSNCSFILIRVQLWYFYTIFYFSYVHTSICITHHKQPWISDKINCRDLVFCLMGEGLMRSARQNIHHSDIILDGNVQLHLRLNVVDVSGVGISCEEGFMLIEFQTLHTVPTKEKPTTLLRYHHPSGLYLVRVILFLVVVLGGLLFRPIDYIRAHQSKFIDLPNFDTWWTIQSRNIIRIRYDADTYNVYIAHYLVYQGWNIRIPNTNRMIKCSSK